MDGCVRVRDFVCGCGCPGSCVIFFYLSFLFLHSRTISHLLFIDGRCVSDAQIEGEQEKITEDKVKQQRQSRT